MLGWLTPDYPPDQSVCEYRVLCPNDDTMRAALRGALLLLSRPYNWEQFGDMTPGDAADWWGTLNDISFNFSECEADMHVGNVVMGLWATAPEGFLLLDGASYAVADYPDLFNIIGYSFGGSGANFNVPDMRDNFPVGAGNNYSDGATGGAATHTLTEAEMPNHSHNTNPMTAVLTDPGTPLPVWGVTGGSTPVSPTGGGQPHNNLPPYLALKFAVKARGC